MIIFVRQAVNFMLTPTPPHATYIPSTPPGALWRSNVEDYPTCPDCHSTAQGRAFNSAPYCGLCEKIIIPVLAPLAVQVRELDPAAWAYARMGDTL